MAPRRRRRNRRSWVRDFMPQILLAFYLFRQRRAPRGERPRLTSTPAAASGGSAGDYRITYILYLLAALLLFGMCVAAVIILGSALALL